MFIREYMAFTIEYHAGAKALNRTRAGFEEVVEEGFVARVRVVGPHAEGAWRFAEPLGCDVDDARADMPDDIDGRSAAQEWIGGASGWYYEKRHPKSSDRERQSEAKGASHLCKSKLNSNHPIRSIVDPSAKAASAVPDSNTRKPPEPVWFAINWIPPRFCASFSVVRSAT